MLYGPGGRFGRAGREAVCIGVLPFPSLIVVATPQIPQFLAKD